MPTWGKHCVFYQIQIKKKANFKSAWECCLPPAVIHLFGVAGLLCIQRCSGGLFGSWLLLSPQKEHLASSAQLQGANPPPGIEAAPSVST